MNWNDPTDDPARPFQSLRVRWREALAIGLGLQPANFQSIRPASPLDGTDEGLWRHLDALPPVSKTSERRVGSYETFSGEYFALVERLKLSPAPLRQVLDPATYRAWDEYLKAQAPDPGRLPALFSTWAAVHAPSMHAVGLSSLTEASIISEALSALAIYKGRDAKQPEFIGGYDALARMLANSPGRSLHFESAHLKPEAEYEEDGDEDESNEATGGGETDGLWAGCDTDARLSRLFAESRVTVRARFDNFAVWAATPGGWYDSWLLNAAYSRRGAPPWPPDAVDEWEAFFGPRGSLRRLVASLVVADGVSVSVVSDAAFSESDRDAIRANAREGTWPFYVPAAEDFVTVDVSFDRSLTTIETEMRPRHPLIIGANVLDTGSYLGRSPSSS